MSCIRPLAFVAVFALVLSSLAVLPGEAQAPIKLGNLVDLTGPTSDQGKDIAQGRIERSPQQLEARRGHSGRRRIGPRDLVAHIQDVDHRALGLVPSQVPGQRDVRQRGMLNPAQGSPPLSS